MTVCIAAICRWSPESLWIVGASDRMLSAPDIKFEPPQQKIYQFTENAIALVAGDPTIQIMICDETARALRAKPRKTIQEIADVYADAFSKYRRQAAEAKHLKPVGLDANSLMERSAEFSTAIVADLIHVMKHEALDAITIIAGIDATGPHLYVVADPGEVTSMDSIAFAAIGSGKAHADSHFMMAKHTRNMPFHKALLDAYVAKKRSEVSPTVGEQHTDLFYIGPSGFQVIEPAVHIELDAIRKEMDGKIATANKEAEERAFAFMKEYTRPREPEAPPVSELAKDEGQKSESEQPT